MAYNKFHYKTAGEKLGLLVKNEDGLFLGAVPVPGRPILKELLVPSKNFPLASEIARREWIIANIFRELIFQTGGTVTVWSGETFDVEPSLGLTGETDYLITAGDATYPIMPPIIAVAEAKKNEILTGVGQCIAEMYAAFIFNERKGKTVKRIFGVVTTGSLWSFLVLEGKTVKMDSREYTLSNLDEILGILVYMTQNV